MPYSVVYAKMGETCRDVFDDLETARADYREKRRADDLQVFDDRFVLGIEDSDGNAVPVD